MFVRACRLSCNLWKPQCRLMRPNKQMQIKAQVLLVLCRKFDPSIDEIVMKRMCHWLEHTKHASQTEAGTLVGMAQTRPFSPEQNRIGGGRSLVFPPADPNGYRHSQARIHAGTWTENPRQREHDREQIFQFNGEPECRSAPPFSNLHPTAAYKPFLGQTIRLSERQQEKKKKKEPAVPYLKKKKQITIRKSREQIP